MRRTLRLFVYAAAMLVVAVGVAALLKDDPGYKAGRSEISGKIVGLTEYQTGKTASVTEQTGFAEEKGSVSSADENPALSSPKSGTAASTSAPFDTRPASVAADTSGTSNSSDAEEKKTSSKSTTTSVEPSSKKTAKAETGTETGMAASVSSGNQTAADTGEAKPTEKRTERVSEAQKPGSSDSTEHADEEKRVSRQVVNPPAEEKPQPRYERVVTSAKFSMQGSQIKLTLQGNAPMVGHYFTLADPDRVVLDIAGNWEVEIPRVPSNRLIRSVRVGLHDDKTRIVFDMKTTGKVALVPLNRNSLELRIQ